MKLKYEFETTVLDNQIIAVPVGDHSREFSGFLKLNKSAAAVLRLLKEETTVEGIVAALLKEYEGTEEEMTAFVEKFTNKLRKEKLLNE